MPVVDEGTNTKPDETDEEEVETDASVLDGIDLPDGLMDSYRARGTVFPGDAPRPAAETPAPAEGETPAEGEQAPEGEPAPAEGAAPAAEPEVPAGAAPAAPEEEAVEIDGEPIRDLKGLKRLAAKRDELKQELAEARREAQEARLDAAREKAARETFERMGTKPAPAAAPEEEEAPAVDEAQMKYIEKRLVKPLSDKLAATERALNEARTKLMARETAETQAAEKTSYDNYVSDLKDEIAKKYPDTDVDGLFDASFNQALYSKVKNVNQIPAATPDEARRRDLNVLTFHADRLRRAFMKAAPVPTAAPATTAPRAPAATPPAAARVLKKLAAQASAAPTGRSAPETPKPRTINGIDDATALLREQIRQGKYPAIG